jgi:hypothetical protein
MESLDIKSLTRELKQTVSDPKTETQNDGKIKKKKEILPKVKTTDMDAAIAEVQQRDDFNTDACVYIDSDIHDVLRQLKGRTKLRIGPFISWLLERFIREHQASISELLKPKANRFIEK